MRPADPHDPEPPGDANERGPEDGDAAELATTVRRELEGLARRYVGDSHTAEDVAQDALAALLEDASIPGDRARLWLLRRVRYLCLDRLKRRAGARGDVGAHFPDLSVASPRTGPRTAALRTESRDELRAQIAALPDAYAEVLVLRYFEGLSRREIAELLDVPEATVKSRLFDASRKLRSSWKVHP